MRFIPIELEIESFNKTFLFSLGQFDWCDDNAYLLSVGFFYGEFSWDICFLNWIKRKYFDRNK